MDGWSPESTFSPLPCLPWSPYFGAGWNGPGRVVLAKELHLPPECKYQLSRCCSSSYLLYYEGAQSWGRKYDVSVDMAYLILKTVFRTVIIMQCSVILVLLGINISEVSEWVSIIEMAKIPARNHREEISSVRKMPGGKYYLHRVQNYRSITVCKFLDRCPVWQLLRCKFHPQPDLQEHRSVIQGRYDLVEILDDNWMTNGWQTTTEFSKK